MMEKTDGLRKRQEKVMIKATGKLSSVSTPDWTTVLNIESSILDTDNG
jgi:hypothetical protein